MEKHSQKCDLCKEKDAVIFVKVFLDGKMEEKGLCASCAVKYLENKEPIKKLSFVDQKLLIVIEEMRDLLAGIITNISAITSMMYSRGQGQKKCGNCGLTYEKFRESGYLGCPECYTALKDQISEFILEVERGTRHRGSMPRKFRKLAVLKKEIITLQKELKQSVSAEDYEKAEKIKKRLERLIGNSSIELQDEIY